MPFVLFISLIFLCCHKEENNDAHFEKSPSVQVTDKLDLYCHKSAEMFAARKWAVEECDGLLFTSLRGIACGDADISVFESNVEPGQWFRDPAHECFPAGSDSTISKDMYIGLTGYLLFRKDADTLRRTIEYGKSHDWIVGDAKDEATKLSKCFITPSLQDLLKNAYNSVGGSLTDISNSDDSIGINSGFQAHLDVLGILIKGKISGKISDIDLRTLKEQARRQPNNALYQAAKSRYDDGDFTAATSLLLAVDKFPELQLPTTDNYCTSYLYQRDESPDDWGPCPGNVTHDGTDFVFAAAIVKGVF